MIWLCNLVLLLQRNGFGAVSVSFCAYLPIFLSQEEKKESQRQYLHLGSPVSVHYQIEEALADTRRCWCIFFFLCTALLGMCLVL